jgi:hypothetical protein
MSLQPMTTDRLDAGCATERLSAGRNTTRPTTPISAVHVTPAAQCMPGRGGASTA